MCAMPAAPLTGKNRYADAPRNADYTIDQRWDTYTAEEHDRWDRLFRKQLEILPGRDGLCHISELSDDYVNSVSDVCRVGDTMKVLVIDIDDHDRVKLSRRRAMEDNGNGGGQYD